MIGAVAGASGALPYYPIRPAAPEQRSAKEPGGDAAPAEDGGAQQAAAPGAAAGYNRLSEAEQRVLQALQQRDDEVRAHEAAHLAASGGLAMGGASFSYETGPDGKRYAVGGEVSIDTSAGRSPEETLRKAEQIRAAALAPAEPSAQDRRVAAEAAQMAAEARAELQQAERAGADKTAPGSGREAADPGPGRDHRAALERLIAGTRPDTGGQQINAYA
ncbi:hypothetical protein dqs_1824 [Azoarcus olearius]|uniref:putative metalloprotease CJM1_0395 family protein n=1 Tax=Azoarcus sp. (strain BH72) TaxID=418699 RepID=UPI0008062253|nr:putative metalloprotease CJM1_0395 family protein [Azoarcus olearius]ANQ84862.1 hypothetical protein dqs_1824 [Azoarcus olearius]